MAKKRKREASGAADEAQVDDDELEEYSFCLGEGKAKGEMKLTAEQAQYLTDRGVTLTKEYE